MFLQIHFLTSYHASLLNRDDVGLAKRIFFGGFPRLRVSSQSQKRRWRLWMTQHSDFPSAIRTRHFFNRVIKKRLIDNGVDEKLAHNLSYHLAEEIMRTSKKKTRAGGKSSVKKETLVMEQPVLFGQPEADYLVQLLLSAADLRDESTAKSYINERLEQERQNFTVMLRQGGKAEPTAGFEGALFGRFITSNILARTDAAVHVAHAFTTHALDTQIDFFTAVDDLLQEDITGAAHTGDMELGSGVYYGYVVVDTPLLLSNLTGCDRKDWREQDSTDARKLIELLIHAISKVSPGAKLGSTAPHAWSECIVLEVGDSQPRSLANAFLRPVRGGRNGSSVMVDSIAAMADYLSKLDEMYGDTGENRFVATIHPWPRKSEPVLPLQEAIIKSLDVLFGDGS